MKYIISESQYNKIRFARRVGQFPIQFVKDTYTYKNPCEFKKFSHWIQRLIDDTIMDWMEEADLDYVSDIIRGDLWDELVSYYSQKC